MQQVEEAHARDLAVRLMSAVGLEPDDIEDFRYEYEYRDQPPGEDGSDSSVEGEDLQDGA